jgi:hypothetical protein
MAKPLSPAAEAARDRFLANVPISLEHGLAAFLLAIKDQLAQADHTGPLPLDLKRAVLDDRIRLLRRITAIADELEGRADG